jgi:hypothetical protein
MTPYTQCLSATPVILRTDTIYYDFPGAVNQPQRIDPRPPGGDGGDEGGLHANTEDPQPLHSGPVPGFFYISGNVKLVNSPAWPGNYRRMNLV